MVGFAKMQGAGNDFVVMRRKDAHLPDEKLARLVCDRRFGVGGDGLLLVDESACADIKMTYWNADGSAAALCGNGLRCFARYAFDEKLVRGASFTVETETQAHAVTVNPDHTVTICVGKAEFAAGNVPVLLPGDEVVDYPYCRYRINVLRVGVPHAVIFVEELDAIDVEHIGRYFSSAPIFPQQINVDFVERYTPRFVRIKTWERGAGHTLSCGTGCCAAVAVGQKRGLLESRVHVETEGGVMTVWRGDDDLLYLCGAAEWVCRGTLSSELLAGVWKRE